MQAENDMGQRRGPISEEPAEIRSLKGKVRDLLEGTEILKHAFIIFARKLDLRQR